MAAPKSKSVSISPKISLNTIIYLDNHQKNEINQDEVLEKVKSAVESENYIKNELSPTNKDALMLSCYLGLNRVAIYLIENNVVDINNVSTEGYSSIMAAYTKGLMDVVSLLLDKNVSLTVRETRENLNVLCIAAKLVNFATYAVRIFEKMKQTLNSREMKEALYTPIFDGKETVLTIACKNANLPLIEAFSLYYKNMSRKQDHFNIHFLDPTGFDARYIILNNVIRYMSSKIALSPDNDQRTDAIIQKCDDAVLNILNLYGKSPNRTYDFPLGNENYKMNIILCCAIGGLSHSLEYSLSYSKPEDFKIECAYSKTILSLLFERKTNEWKSDSLVKQIFTLFVPFLHHFDFTRKDINGASTLMTMFSNGFVENCMYLLLKGHITEKMIIDDMYKDTNIISIGCERLIAQYYENRYNRDEEKYRTKFMYLSEIIKRVANKNNDFPLMIDGNGNSLIHYCTGIHGCLPIVKYIMQRNPLTKINQPNVMGLTPLVNACITNNVEVAKFLLSIPSVVYNSKEPIFNPILLACQLNTDEIAMALLEKQNIDLNVKDTYGFPPFTLACLHRNENLALKLLDTVPILDILSEKFITMSMFDLVSICGLSPAVKEKLEKLTRETGLTIGEQYTYNENDKVFDLFGYEQKTVKNYLDENPENMCFIIENDGIPVYGFTKKQKLREALDVNDTHNNNLVYGCHKKMSRFLNDYLWSHLPEKQQEAYDNVDMNYVYTYLQKYVNLYAFVDTNELTGLFHYPKIEHRCYRLVPNSIFQYESAITRHLIDSTGTDSVGTIHCDEMPKPVIYEIYPCFPSTNAKKRGRSPSVSPTKSLSPKREKREDDAVAVARAEPMIYVNYRDSKYGLKYEDNTTMEQLKELFLIKLVEKLAEEEKPITDFEDPAKVNVIFTFSGKIYRTVGEQGQLKVKELAEKYPDIDEIVLTTTLRKMSGGKFTRKIRAKRFTRKL